MPLSRRYSPEWAPGETATIGMDFSAIIPPGVGIEGASLFIETNTALSTDASADWSGPPHDPSNPQAFEPSILGRVVYAQMSGGVLGKDYRFIWIALDTQGNNWPRTGLLLCAPTS